MKLDWKAITEVDSRSLTDRVAQGRASALLENDVLRLEVDKLQKVIQTIADKAPEIIPDELKIKKGDEAK